MNQSARPILDFRSDTVTRPTLGMLQAMMQAEVGDDVYQEDPTVIELEQQLARMFGQEAGLFCASGTMSNQIAIMAQTRPGDAVLCSDLCHIYNYEGGGLAANAGVQAQLISGGAEHPGQFRLEQLEQALHADDVHYARARVVAVEDTSNRGGGSLWPREELERIGTWADDRGLIFHLDGARVFNRLVATGESVSDYGELFTSISVCLSKGLGAPVGSVLLGSKAMISQARRVRKRLGGGMRQAGYLAAAGLYALEHHVPRLCEDHAQARALARMFAANKAWIKQVVEPQSNIILIQAHESRGSVALCEELRAHDVWVSSIDERWARLVTHQDVRGIEVLEKVSEALDAIKKA